MMNEMNPTRSWVVVLLLLWSLLSPQKSTWCCHAFSNAESSRVQKGKHKKQRDSRADSSVVKKAPIYITIGPQCSGKTTFLSRQRQPSVIDIALDDQPNVYVPVPTEFFLHERALPSNKRFLKRRVQRKSLAVRVYDTTQAELRAILQRYDGILTPVQFNERITEIYRNHTIDAIASRTKQDPALIAEQLSLNPHQLEEHAYTGVAQQLIHVVESTMSLSEAPPLPDTIQLFCVESLFRVHPGTNQTAVERATSLFKRLSVRKKRQAIAWGNTNTRPREYRTVLQVAAQQKRPVEFIIFDSEGLLSTHLCSCPPHQLLPQVSFRELVRRNVNRLLETGKYVPAKAVWDTLSRGTRLIESTLRDLDRKKGEGGDVDGERGVHTKLEYDRQLANMLNFDLLDDRTVSR